ncbi:hypothetical protein [Streptomyces abikoensis]|uniref:hypothetical protein n=1 Tax=Streptomyces abikoensis TaxID=97398 RepID=UPI0036B6FEA1
MTADLSPLLNASELWHKMGKRFGELKGDYERNVQQALANGNWQGQAFTAHQISAAATASEYVAAQTEALAVAGLLTQAHAELTRLQKLVKDLVADAEAKDFHVDGSGKVAYVGFNKLSAQEQDALRHAPDYPQLEAQAQKAAQEWTDGIAMAVRAVDEADQGVRRALTRAATGHSAGGNGFGGFNAHAEGDLAKAGAPEDVATKTDGWHVEGKFKATGPDIGRTPSGPKYGKEGSFKGYIDLFHITAQGSASNGHLKLSGIVDAYEGARGTANYGFTDKGAVAKAEVSAGQRGLAEARTEYGPIGEYARVEGFNGAEGSISAKATKDELTVGAKAFAGKKATVAGGVEVAGIGFGATAEGWQGPGAEAWWGYKKENGVWKFGSHAGASPGAGGSAGFEITVDPDKLKKAVGHAADAVGDAAGSIKKTVSSWL